ncbi:MAG: cytidylate kinase-like family protein [Magnetococcales bacterium]|nr:cytidylate kinase-like family protein [Magnetococcales bacterium]
MVAEMGAVRGLIRSTFFDGDQEAGKDPAQKRPVITLSRDLGALGEEVALLLGERLGLDLFGYSVVDSIIQQSHTDKHLTKMLDERVNSTMDEWIRSMLGGPGLTMNDYIRQLVRIVMAIAPTGGIIIGRGAHLILSRHPRTFRVRVEGSHEACVGRVARHEGLTREEAERKVAETNRERAAFVREVYKHFPSDRNHYDLVINSDHLDPKSIADIILLAMARRGLIAETAAA